VYQRRNSQAARQAREGDCEEQHADQLRIAEIRVRRKRHDRDQQGPDETGQREQDDESRRRWTADRIDPTRNVDAAHRAALRPAGG
jgi:hypothetical protein